MNYQAHKMQDVSGKWTFNHMCYKLLQIRIKQDVAGNRLYNDILYIEKNI